MHAGVGLISFSAYCKIKRYTGIGGITYRVTDRVIGSGVTSS